MLVSLIKKDKIYSVSLPMAVNGTYWVCDSDRNGNERKLLSIEEKNGEWVLKSNNDNKIIEEDRIINEVVLKNYSFQYIQIEKEEIALLYCCPVYDPNNIQIEVKNSVDFIIGKSQLCKVIFNLPTVSDEHAKLVYNNGNWQITDLNSKFGTYVNNERLIGTKDLKHGDIIFITGLKIIVLGNLIITNNPFNRVKYSSDIFSLYQKAPVAIEPTNEEKNAELEVYEESDYFFRSPRFRTIIEKEEMVIDPPPGKEKQEDIPFIYTMGPMMTMGMSSILSLYNTVDSISSGERTLQQSLPSLVMAVGMLASMFLWPLLTKRYQKKQKIKREKERQEKYGAYVEKKRNEIDLIMKKQKQILIENFITLEECEKIILSKNRQLWERKIDHSDFLSLRLGIGDTPLELDIKYPEEHFSMDEDNLKDILNTLVDKSKDLKNVPISISLTEKYILGAVGKWNETKEFMKQLILQLITFHSYEDVKLVFFIDEKHISDWEYAKILPHVWSNDKQLRFFATNYEEMCEVSLYLERVLEPRIEQDKEDFKSFSPYYIIITDNYKISKNVQIIIKALKLKKNVGMNVIVLNENLSTLPNECTTFLSINGKNGAVFESELTSDKQKEFSIDNYTQGNFINCCKKVANVPIKFTQDSYALPNLVDFLEMYNVGKVEQLNSVFRWKMSNPTSTLQAPIGIDSNGMLFKLDIHEKAHGPHGLIAGMTGSGKSEFIITYILSLAVNYHPNDVSFILIDYKGGGLAGAFKNDDTGVKLPHLAGTITNLDTLEMNRSLVSIQSELRRRQSIFNEARQALNEGTIDIYKYQKFYHEGLVKEPVSHLLIISDEFAELKAQQPEFMDQLISAARIGRSLGVHLILATQKPSGVVNDQIWSNARFRVCLKVQDKSDSNDMLKVPDAALIKQTGRFYLQVGYNEFFGLGQSAWCGAPYFPMEKVKKKIDTAMNFVNNIGSVIKESDEIRTDKVAAQGEQLTNIVKYLSDIAEKENIKIKQLWLDKIPPFIFLDKLAIKYNYKAEPFVINPIIGEFDDPFNQRQGLLTLPLSTNGNTIIYGSAGSGKEQMLNAIIYSTMTTHKPEEVNFYILEFGAESLRVFSKSPHIGDILYINDSEKISNLFKMLKTEIERRKKLFSDYSGDYQTYIKVSGSSVPNFVVIINNYEAFTEVYANYEEIILQLTREGIKYGIFFIFTTSASNMIRYRLAQNFKQKLVLQLNDENDYSSILGNVRGTKPSEIVGRGLIDLGAIYEFQTASICDPNKINDTIRQTCEQLCKQYEYRAKAVPILPARVTYSFVKDSLAGLNSIPVGVEKKSLKVSTVDLLKNYTTIITSLDIISLKSLTTEIIKEVNLTNSGKLIVIDAEEILDSKKINNVNYYNNALDSIFVELYTEINNAQEIYQKSNYDKKSIEHITNLTCVICGIDKLSAKLSLDNKKLLGKMFECGKELGKYCFVLVDSVDKFKKIEYDDWYRNTVNNNRGIWVGDGIANQFAIKLTKTTKELYEEVGNRFGYIIERGIPVLIKLLEEELTNNE